MTGSGYPEQPKATFDQAIDPYRCRSVADGRRCQLWAKHLEACYDHAAAWSEPRVHPLHREGLRGVAPRHWWRWGADGVVREQEPGSERLPWASMGVP
jgi:hypothetical protein